MQLPQSFDIPPSVLQEYGRFAGAYERSKKWIAMSDSELWYNLCLCTLSSNVPFEMAKSAFLQLSIKNLIEYHNVSRLSTNHIRRELSKPIYLPRKKDGSFRRYRFPRRRALDIVRARDFLHKRYRDLTSLLTGYSSAEDARNFLAQNVPGIGLKQASQFLRNIGFSESLAIIDSHILQFIRSVGGEVERTGISPSKYLELEQFMRTMAHNHGLSLAVLDYAIWESMRR